MGLTFDQLFPGRFIKAGEMHGKDVTLTIKSVYVDNIEGEDGREKPQAIITFSEIAREWALNRTNASCLRAMWGDDTDHWIGKRVTLYPENDSSGMSESGVCLRVKGSPDLDKTIEATIKLPRRRPVTRKLLKTKAGGSGAFDAEAGEAGDIIPDPSAPTEYQDVSFGGFDDLGES